MRCFTRRRGRAACAPCRSRCRESRRRVNSVVGLPWSAIEVTVTVRDYFDMLEDEVHNRPYSKTEHRRRLVQLLDGRTEQAIEYKHRNISAVLRELQCRYIIGYKPLANIQSSLAEAVDHELLDRATYAPGCRSVMKVRLGDAQPFLRPRRGWHLTPSDVVGHASSVSGAILSATIRLEGQAVRPNMGGHRRRPGRAGFKQVLGCHRPSPRSRGLPGYPAEFLIIDGQQRLTTLFIILTAVADLARTLPGGETLVEDIAANTLINSVPHARGCAKGRTDAPGSRAVSRARQQAVVDGVRESDASVRPADRPHARDVRQNPAQGPRRNACARSGVRLGRVTQRELAYLLRLETEVRDHLKMVAIRLGVDDDPHQVFDRLNSGGIKLKVLDLGAERGVPTPGADSRGCGRSRDGTVGVARTVTRRAL